MLSSDVYVSWAPPPAPCRFNSENGLKIIQSVRVSSYIHLAEHILHQIRDFTSKARSVCRRESLVWGICWEVLFWWKCHNPKYLEIGNKEVGPLQIHKTLAYSHVVDHKLIDLRLCRPHTYTHTNVDVVFLEKLFWKAVYFVQCKYLFS